MNQVTCVSDHLRDRHSISSSETTPPYFTSLLHENVVKMAYSMSLLGLLICSVISASYASINVPVVAWSNTRDLFSTRQIAAGEEITPDSLNKEFLDQGLGLDQAHQTIVLILLNKLSLGDLTRYSNAYASDNQGGIIPNIKSSMEKSASSLVLPQTDTSMLVDDLMSKVNGGEVTEVSDLAELKSASFNPNQNNLFIIRIPASDSMEEQLVAADTMVKAAMEKVQGEAPKTRFTFFFSAAPMAKDSSRSSGRHLLATEEASSFIFANFTSDNCTVFFYASYINASLVYTSSSAVNKSLILPKEGWNLDGSDCISSTVVDFVINFPDLKGYNGSTWLDSVSMKLRFNTTSQGFWYTTESTMTYQLDGGSSETMDINPPDNFETPLDWSYHCGDITLQKKNTTGLTEMVMLVFKDFQIQPFSVSNDQFSSANDCIGYFTPAIWMGVITVLMIVAIVGFGIGMMAMVRVMDKFDDPKGKQLVINVPES